MQLRGSYQDLEERVPRASIPEFASAEQASPQPGSTEPKAQGTAERGEPAPILAGLGHHYPQRQHCRTRASKPATMRTISRAVVIAWLLRAV